MDYCSKTCFEVVYGGLERKRWLQPHDVILFRSIRAGSYQSRFENVVSSGILRAEIPYLRFPGLAIFHDESLAAYETYENVLAQF